MMKTMRVAMAAMMMAGGLSGAAMAQSRDGMSRVVTIDNQSGATITQFYASNVGTNDWQEDLLGADVLPSGESVTINIDDGTGYCRYDFRAVYEDGSEEVDARVNVCGGGTATYTGN